MKNIKLKSVVTVALVVIMASCAAPPKKKEEVVFFPPPPELPRIQYLVSFNGSKDVEKQSAFQLFIMGEREAIFLDKPYGIGIHNGKLYVCDTNRTVTVLDFKENKYGFLKGARGPGKLIQPIDIAIEPDGTKYVADPVRGQVVAFNDKDEYLRAYGRPGDWKPVASAVFEGRLYVADIKNSRVVVIDKKSGETVATIGAKGNLSERLGLPANLAFDSHGDLYVSDAARFQIVKYDRDGHFKSVFGQEGDAWSHFARPKGITLDREGRFYVVDAAFNNVQIFNNEGRLLLFFGEAGDEPGNFILPAQVIVDYNNMEYFRKYVQPNFEMEHLIIVTNQFGDHKVSLFAYGKEKGATYPSDEELLKQIEELKQKKLEELKKKETKEEPQERKEEGKTDSTGKADENRNPAEPQKEK